MTYTEQTQVERKKSVLSELPHSTIAELEKLFDNEGSRLNYHVNAVGTAVCLLNIWLDECDAEDRFKISICARELSYLFIDLQNLQQ